MKRMIPFVALLFLAASDPRQAVIGHWVGTSLCTPVRPACHDEKASSWMKAAKDPDVVTVDFDKIVDGKDERMGTEDVHIDWKTNSLTCVIVRNGQRWVWSLLLSGSTMTGTLKESDGQVVRNVRIARQKS